MLLTVWPVEPSGADLSAPAQLLSGPVLPAGYKGYDYSPTMIRYGAAGIDDFWWCGESADSNGGTEDMILHQRFTNGAPGPVQAVLSYESPGHSSWSSSHHSCDPSVVKGSFPYNGSTYTHAMFYTSNVNNPGNGNTAVGVAYSNNGTSWVLVPTVGLTGRYQPPQCASTATCPGSTAEDYGVRLRVIRFGGELVGVWQDDTYSTLGQQAGPSGCTSPLVHAPDCREPTEMYVATLDLPTTPTESITYDTPAPAVAACTVDGPVAQPCNTTTGTNSALRIDTNGLIDNPLVTSPRDVAFSREYSDTGVVTSYIYMTFLDAWTSDVGPGPQGYGIYRRPAGQLFSGNPGAEWEFVAHIDPDATGSMGNGDGAFLRDGVGSLQAWNPTWLQSHTLPEVITYYSGAINSPNNQPGSTYDWIRNRDISWISANRSPRTTRLNRYYHSTFNGGRHFATTAQATPLGFNPEPGATVYVESEPESPTGQPLTALYSCFVDNGPDDWPGSWDRNPSVDTFASISPACEGHERWGRIGWIYPTSGAQPPGTSPLYRCSLNGNHWLTTYANCEIGLAPETTLGYVWTTPQT